MGVESIYDKIARIYSEPPPTPQSLLHPNYLLNPEGDKRPLSVIVFDKDWGDSGKGKELLEVMLYMQKKLNIREGLSIRPNGGKNAGHEVHILNIHGEWVAVSLHQLPVAILVEGYTAIISKTMICDPIDLVTEIAYLEHRQGSQLQANLLIDSQAIVGSDLTSAFESYTNNQLGTGKGATGSGIGQAYSSFYEKRDLTMGDLAASDWRNKFALQYRYYASLMRNHHGVSELKNILVNRLTLDGGRIKEPVGTLHEYLDRLEEARRVLLPHIMDTYDLVDKTWKQELHVPIVIETAQGSALDPFLGVRPDITASRTLPHINVSDATEGTIQYRNIAMPIAVLKQPYTSIVGSKIPPYELSNAALIDKYRNENDEFGRSTGRPRGIYPLDFVKEQTLGRVIGPSFTAITHFDANREDRPIEVVYKYEDKKTGIEKPYRPHQDNWNQVNGIKTELPSWDGKAVSEATNVTELPENALRFIALAGEIYGRVIAVTNGKEAEKSIHLFQDS